MRVHKFKDHWIDLDHVLAIGDAAFINRMGSGGWFVGFHLIMAFRDRPLLFERQMIYNDEHRFIHEKGYHVAKLVDGTETDSPGSLDDQRQLVAVAALQKEVDELVRIWRGNSLPPGAPHSGGF